MGWGGDCNGLADNWIDRDEKIEKDEIHPEINRGKYL